jgi:6-phosphogluconolactonase (cycloisomerase 2 family)
VASRGENSLSIANFDPKNSTALPSDPILTYQVNQASGALTLVQTASAGGRNPRGFKLNKAGTLVASALQDDNRVVIIERDVKTGMLGKILAWATVGAGESNGPPYVQFDE